MSVEIKSGAGSNLASVNSNNELNVALSASSSAAGYVTLLGESHNGQTGAAQIRRALRVSTDGRLRSGLDSLLWTYTFNHTVKDSGKFKFIDTTATSAMTSGVLSMNSGSSVTSGQGTLCQTFQTFPLFGSSSLEVGFRARFTQTPQTNNTCELGLAYATGVATPTDGVYFKVASDGNLYEVKNFNGTEVATNLNVSITQNRFYYFSLVVDQDRLEFYVDGQCMGVIEVPTDAPTATMCRSLPVHMRIFNNGTVTLAQKMDVSDQVVILRDLSNPRSAEFTSAYLNNSSVTVPDGTAAGQTQNYANSAAPASATLSNTAAGYTTLGGQWQFAAVAGAETDYALFGYQVPAASVTGGNRKCIIWGVHIETYNMGAASATTPTLLQWAIGVGSTAVSLATTDSATTGARAPRRLLLGTQSIPVGTAVGAAVSPIDVRFKSPLVAEPGTWVHIILKMPVGTATASQIIRGSATLDAMWE